MSITLGNILVALTVLSMSCGILYTIIVYGGRLIVLVDLMLRVVAWYSKETGYPIPKELADRYIKVNGNKEHPLPHKSGEHQSAKSKGLVNK